MPAAIGYYEPTLRTSPSSGQAAFTSQLRRPKLPACHSRAAFGLQLQIHRPGASHQPLGAAELAPRPLVASSAAPKSVERGRGSGRPDAGDGGQFGMVAGWGGAVAEAFTEAY